MSPRDKKKAPSRGEIPAGAITTSRTNEHVSMSAVLYIV